MSSSLSWAAEVAPYLTSRSTAALSTTTNDAAPRLGVGPHWGIIQGFEALTEGAFDREARAQVLMDEAAAKLRDDDYQLAYAIDILKGLSALGDQD